MAKKIHKNNLFFGLNLTNEQKEFRDSIYSGDYDIIFCNSKAGTGKTLISIATAKLLVSSGDFNGMVYIVFPVNEFKQGFLPGDLNTKTLPYAEPLHDALIKINEQPDKVIKQYGIINKNGDSWVDCISHSYLRGINFENKVVIIDEMQNGYEDECKKILTRCHDNCRVVCIGHHEQTDLYKYPEKSGFVRYLEHFSEQERAKVCTLSQNFRGWISSHADKLS